MHEISDAEKEFLDAAKDLVGHYDLKNGRLVFAEAERELANRRLTNFVALGKLLPRGTITPVVVGLAKDIARNKVLAYLRSGHTSTKEVALLVGVSHQVVMGIKSHWTQGKYGDPVIPKPPPVVAVISWCYLILSSTGAVYLGATTDLRRRLRSHNSPANYGYTRGQCWHLLAALQFPSRKEAFDYETKLKGSMSLKKEWKIRSIGRAKKIVSKYQYSFSPDVWNHSTV